MPIRKPHYRPGDNLIVCDLSGQTMYMSDSVKTWDGLRVNKKYWYERHPQLDVRGIPEAPGVIDGRPEQPWQFVNDANGSGPVILQSPDQTIWQLTVDNSGVISATRDGWQPEVNLVYIDDYYITVTNAGVPGTVNGDVIGPSSWLLVSPNGSLWSITVPSGTLTATVV